MRTKEVQTLTATLHEVIGQIAAEVAAPLTRALDRLQALADGGSADAGQLQALHDEISRARRIGILGQQIARLASGAVRQVPEPVDLSGMLRELLTEQRSGGGHSAVPVRETLVSAIVMADSGLAGTLLRSMLDWCQESALALIDLRLDARPAAAQAVLLCRFTRQPHDPHAPEPLSWQLMHFAAARLGARLLLDEGPASTVLTLLFDRLVTLAEPAPTAAADARLLAGCQLLVVSPDRDIRHQVRRAVQGLDLLVDYVTSVEAACAYCEEGLPQAVVYASTLAGAPLDRLRRRLGGEAGAPPFIEIAPHGHSVETAAAGHRTVARVGADGLAEALPAALANELARRR